MAITATLAMVGSNPIMGSPVNFKLIITNSSASDVTLSSVTPKAFPADRLKATPNSSNVIFGLPFTTPQSTTTISASGGTLTQFFQATFSGLPSGSAGAGSNIYSVSADVAVSDGSTCSPTAQTVAVNVPNTGPTGTAQNAGQLVYSDPKNSALALP